MERGDLWEFLGSVSHGGSGGRPVHIGDIMEPWVAQPGFPALTLTRSGSVLSLTQVDRRGSGPQPQSLTSHIPLLSAASRQPRDQSLPPAS